jgi:hypothetical protein
MSVFDIIQCVLMLVCSVFTYLAWRELHIIRRRQEGYVQPDHNKEYYV